MADLILRLYENAQQHFIPSLQIEAFRYSLGTLATFFIVWIGLSRFIAGRKIRPPTPRSRQIKMEIFNSLRAMLVFVVMDIVVFEMAGSGVFQKYDEIATYGWAYFFFSIALLIVLHDAYFYWVHRAMHTQRFYKRFHLTHHRSHNPTPFTAYSFAVGEAVVEYMYVPIALLLIPTHGLALYIVLMIMIFKNATAHCGYELFPRHWARLPVLGWLTTVTHHDMHHERGTGNFGFYFTWWDRWMGTEHPNYLDRLDTQIERTRQMKLKKANPDSENTLLPAE